jgi:hypothetical protein
MVRPAPIPSDPADRARRHAGCHRHRGNATITRSKRLRRRDQMTAPIVEKRRYRRKSLPDGFNIDYHHNIWYDNSVVNQYFYSLIDRFDNFRTGPKWILDEILMSVENNHFAF